jgi:hypothetical protein
MLVEAWREGNFPFTDLIVKYPAEDMNTAAKNVLSGKVIKAVLVWKWRTNHLCSELSFPRPSNGKGFLVTQITTNSTPHSLSKTLWLNEIGMKERRCEVTRYSVPLAKEGFLMAIANMG